MIPRQLLIILVRLAAEVSCQPDQCSAFLTNTQANSTPAIFSYDRFYDFRNVSSQHLLEDHIPSAEPDAAFRSVGDHWVGDWSASNLLRGQAHPGWAPILFTAKNIEIGGSADSAVDGSTFLQLETSRLPNGTQQSAELVYTEHNVTSMSFRVRARVDGVPGGVAGFFTYYNDTQETDLEVVTRDPEDRFHCSNQPTWDAEENAVPGASYNLSMKELGTGSSWRDWNTYRIDWLPGQSIWFVNGKKVAETSVNVPFTSTRIYIAMFGNGGSWSGDMREGDSAVLQIQWIHVAFNSTATPESGVKEERICDIDDESFVESIPPPATLDDQGSLSHSLVIERGIAWSGGLSALLAMLCTFI